MFCYRTKFESIIGLSVISLTPCLLISLPAADLREPVPVFDPVPLERIALDRERLASEMERRHLGVLTEVGRDEFDTLVRRAATATDAVKSPPRLIEAHYRAALNGNGLVGTAEWRIVHRGNRPGRLSLSALQIALRQGRWGGDRAAIIGVFDDRTGANPELLIEKSGESSLTLGWSARGLSEPGGLRFDLKLPSSPITILELELPSDTIPQADREGCLLTGPFPIGEAQRQSWRLTLPAPGHVGIENVPLLLQRPIGLDQPGPVVRPSIQSNVKLIPGQAECEFDIDLLVQGSGIRELTIECDAGLQPYEVVIPGLESWETKTDPNGAMNIHVRLRDAFQGGRATVKALLALPGPSSQWTCPGVRVVGGLIRGETLTLQIDPALQLDDWNPGSFRIADERMDVNRSRTLMLRSVLGGSSRPVSRIRTGEAMFDVRQTSEWQLDEHSSVLTTQFHLMVRRGVLFQLPISIPAGWEVDRVEVGEGKAASRWTLQPASGKTPERLTVELEHPLAVVPDVKDDDAGRFALTVRLRSLPIPPSTDPSAVIRLSFPDLAPLGARQREGTLSIRPGPELVASVETALVEMQPNLFAIHGADSEGLLFLRRRPSSLTATCDSETTIRGQWARSTFRLQLQPSGSVGRELLIITSSPMSGAWVFRTLKGPAEVQTITPVNAFEPARNLAAAFPTSALNALVSLATPQILAGFWWRILLDRPLEQALNLELTCDSAAQESRCDIPLLSLPTAATLQGTATVRHPAGADWDAITQRALEVAPSHGHRVFRYGPAPPKVTLVASRTKAEPAGRGTLTVQASQQGKLTAQFAFQIAGWREQQLPVRLPPGATLVRAEVEGRLLLIDAGSTILLPRPANANLTARLVYTVPAPSWHIANEYHAAAPELPFPIPVRRVWRLPGDLVPAAPEHWCRVAEAKGPSGQEQALEGMTDWEPPPGQDGSAITVVRRNAISIGGATLAGLLSALALAGWTVRWRRLRPVLLLTLVAGGLAWLWLPMGLRELARWPLIVATLAVFVALLGALMRRAPSPLDEVDLQDGAVAPLTIAVALTLAIGGSAAAPGPTPVFLVKGDAGQTTVFAPPELLDRLRKLCAAGEPSTGAVLSGVRYEGGVDGNTAHFEAKFSAHCLSDMPVVLSIPLGGVRLRDALVDGSPAFPRLAAADRYDFRLIGKGTHAISLHFDAPISGGPDREIRFSVPELPLSSIAFRGASGSEHLQLFAARGVQTIEPEALGPRLDADLGRVGIVQLRWRQPSAEPVARPKVQEFALWDVRDSGSRLLAIFVHHLGVNSTPRLEYDIPADLEVAAASVRAVDDQAKAAGMIGLSDWRKTGNPARLRLDFQTPLGGKVQVMLELVPRRAIDRRPALPLPAARGAGERESWVAVRVRDWDAALNRAVGLAPVVPEAFQQQWLALRVEPGSRLPTFAFRVATGQTPALQIALHPLTQPTSATTQIVWRVGPSRADFRAVANWSKAPPAGPVEWQIPAGLTVTDAAGRYVSTWSREGTRLQVWLNRAAKFDEIAVEIAGWMSRPRADADQEKSPFVLPAIRLSGAEPPVVSVQPRGDWRIAPVEVTGYRSLPDTDLPGWRWSAVAPSSGGQAVFAIRPARGHARFAILSAAHTTSDQMSFTSTIDVQPAKDNTTETATVIVELGRAVEFKTALDIPSGARLRETRNRADGMTWVIDLAPGPHRITVNAQRSLAGGREVAFPETMVRAPGPIPGQTRHLLALTGPWQTSSQAGLRPIPPPWNDLPDTIRSGKVWTAQGTEWSLSLQPPGTSIPKAIGLPADVRAIPGPDGRWLINVRFAELTNGDKDWQILPAGNELLAVEIDGRETAWHQRQEQIPLTLPVAPASHTVRLICRSPRLFAEGTSAIQLPRLLCAGEPLKVDSTTWTIRVPPGYEPRSAGMFTETPAGATSPPTATGDEFERGIPYFSQTVGETAPAVEFVAISQVSATKIALSCILGLVMLGGLIWSTNQRGAPE